MLEALDDQTVRQERASCYLDMCSSGSGSPTTASSTDIFPFLPLPQLLHSELPSLLLLPTRQAPGDGGGALGLQGGQGD